MGRPRNIAGKTRVNVGATVLPEIDQLIARISEVEDRSRSQVIEKMLLRGIAAYLRDGALQEIADHELLEADAARLPKLTRRRKV